LQGSTPERFIDDPRFDTYWPAMKKKERRGVTGRFDTYWPAIYKPPAWEGGI
jgi:hypothetical protein